MFDIRALQKFSDMFLQLIFNMVILDRHKVLKVTLHEKLFYFKRSRKSVFFMTFDQNSLWLVLWKHSDGV